MICVDVNAVRRRAEELEVAADGDEAEPKFSFAVELVEDAAPTVFDLDSIGDGLREGKGDFLK